MRVLLPNAVAHESGAVRQSTAEARFDAMQKAAHHIAYFADIAPSKAAREESTVELRMKE